VIVLIFFDAVFDRAISIAPLSSNVYVSVSAAFFVPRPPPPPHPAPAGPCAAPPPPLRLSAPHALHTHTIMSICRQ
jgi:hypothetical protein